MPPSSFRAAEPSRFARPPGRPAPSSPRSRHAPVPALRRFFHLRLSRHDRMAPVTRPGGGSTAAFDPGVCLHFQLDEGEATPPAWGCTMTDTLIDRNPEILGGTPVFAGTRVPVRILIEHLEAGDRLDDFLVDYPTVSRRQAVAVLERATTMLVSGGDEAAA